ncbi:MAG: sensor histidine kinase [Hyphomonadaceae bacterium]
MKRFAIFSENSLARRLMGSAGVIGIVLLGGIVLILSTLYTSQIVTILDNELDRTVTTLQGAVDADEAGIIVLDEEREPSDQFFERPLSGRYWSILVQENGGTYRAVRSSASVWDGNLPWSQDNSVEAIEHSGHAVRTDGTGPNGEPLRLVGQAMILPEMDKPLILLVGFDRSETDRGSLRFTLILVATMFALGVGFLIALLLGIRSALRPLRRIETDIADVREGRRTLMETDYPLEVLPLNLELNKLLEHNRGIVERAQTHVGNLAHALKTPLAVLINEAQGTEPLDDVVRRQAGAMHDNVQHYLKRARAAARAQVVGARSEVKPVLEDLSRLLNKLFDRQGVSVDVRCPAGVFVRVEKQDLEEMVGNLMENACKWSAGNVKVQVVLSTGSVMMHIDDDGPGLEPDERIAALQRGVRLDEAAPGTGLGLSIVTELADMHEGAFVLEEAPELGGLRASLRLPRA